MSRKVTLFGAIALMLGLLIWAPWMARQRAETRAGEEFASAWEGIIDGCGFGCEGCGVKAARRILVGYLVEIEYACGLLPYDSPEFHLTDTVYVSPLRTVHGLKTP